MRVKNSKGFSPWSDGRVFTTAAPRPPDTPEAPTSRDLNDYWRDPIWIGTWWLAPYDEGLPILEYEVCVTSVDESGQTIDADAFRNPDTNCDSSYCCITSREPTYTLQVGVKAPTPYVYYRLLSIRARNAAGWSASSPTVLLHTQYPLKPRKMNSLQAAPHLLTTTSHHGKCRWIAVEWHDVASAGLSVLNYELMTDDDQATVVNQVPSRRASWLGSFSPGSNHSVRVRGENALGFSPWSEPVFVETYPQDLPPKINPPIQQEILGLNNGTSSIEAAAPPRPIHPSTHACVYMENIH